jgi:hypothetical protein
VWERGRLFDPFIAANQKRVDVTEWIRRDTLAAGVRSNKLLSRGDLRKSIAVLRSFPRGVVAFGVPAFSENGRRSLVTRVLVSPTANGVVMDLPDARLFELEVNHGRWNMTRSYGFFPD